MNESQPQARHQPQSRFQPSPRFQPDARYQPQTRFQPQSRFKVPLAMDVIGKCLCRECPVQADSGCARPKITVVKEILSRMTPETMKSMAQDQATETMPEPSDMPGPYCSIGEAVCKDHDFSKSCMCSQCQVFSEFNLDQCTPTEYFCRDGGAA